MEGCAGGGEENRYIRLHVAGASEATTIRNGDFTCCYCGAQLVEDVSLRTLASKYICNLNTLKTAGYKAIFYNCLSGLY